MPDRHEAQIPRANQEERGYVPKGIDVSDSRDLVGYCKNAACEGLAGATKISAVAVESYRHDGAFADRIARIGGRDAA